MAAPQDSTPIQGIRVPLDDLAEAIARTLATHQAKLAHEKRTLLVRSKLHPRKPQQAPGPLFEPQQTLFFYEED